MSVVILFSETAAISNLAWTQPSVESGATSLNSSSYLPPIRFHEVHREYVHLSRDNCMAVSYDDIVFTNRTVGIKEKIFIRPNGVHSLWFGLTSKDPADHNLEKLRFTFSDRPFGIEAEMLDSRFVRNGLVLCLYVNEDGQVHYAVDGDDIGILFDGVKITSPLWGLFQFQGIIELVDPHRPPS